jgi:hypothetical protein
MPSRDERVRARARLLETPISDDESLPKLQEQAESYVREAKRRNTQELDVSTLIDAVARDYFRHVVRRRRATTSRS